jgi:hypothetical protein
MEFLGSTIAAMLALGGLAAALAALRNARRNREALLDAWAEGAVSAGLTEPRPRNRLLKPHLTARDGDLWLRIELYNRDEDERGLRLTVSGLAQPSGSLRIRRESLRTEMEKRLLGIRETETGDERFDSRFFIQGPRALAMALLGCPARLELGRLLDGLLSIDATHEVVVGAELDADTLTVEVSEVSLAAASAGDLLPGLLQIARALRRPADLNGRLAANLLAERDPLVRVRLLETLAAEFPESPRTRQSLLAACDDPDARVRLRAAIELRAEGRETLASLVSARSVDDTTRARALTELGPRVPANVVEETLRRALDEDTPVTARACLEALRRFRRQESEPLLWQALESADVPVALAAVQALRTCGSVEAVPRLLDVAGRGSSEELRTTAREAVAAIQARLLGAAAGQLALVEETAGALSLAETATGGELSLAQPRDSADGETTNAAAQARSHTRARE